MWKVRSFGQDCMGNITGYVVERYVWVPRDYSQRNDGLAQEREEAGTFVGNIYRDGSFNEAKAEANALCERLNDEMAERSPKSAAILRMAERTGAQVINIAMYR